MCSSTGVELDASRHGSSFLLYDLPLDQWTVEVQLWFETSLARIQVEALTFVQGIYHEDETKYVNILPPSYQELCSMVKFKTVGWRNVSVWGLFGLLFLSAAISLASIKTAEDHLWLMVGARAIGRILSRIKDEVMRVPWTRAWRSVRGVWRNYWPEARRMGSQWRRFVTLFFDLPLNR